MPRAVAQSLSPRAEVEAAVGWLLGLITSRSPNIKETGNRQLSRYLFRPLHQEITPFQLESFKYHLINLLEESCEMHWYRFEPGRKQAFRAIHVSPSFQNELIKEAADMADIPYEALYIDKMYFTIWIDPGMVTARFNDDDPLQEVFKQRTQH